MALTRKMLKAMGIEDEKMDQIMDAHTEAVDGFKTGIAKYKADAEQLDSIQKQLDAANSKLKSTGRDSFEEKYNQIKQEFDAFKVDAEAKETRAAKENAYREVLKTAGIGEKYIPDVLRVSQLDDLTLENGKVKGSDKLTEAIKEKYGAFIVTTRVRGAETASPPANIGGGDITKDQIMAIKDRAARRAAIADNMNLFEKGE